MKDDDQLSKNIEKKFILENKKIVDTPKEKQGIARFFRILLSLVITSVMMGSLIYSIVSSLR